jgi:hypothetical protein
MTWPQMRLSLRLAAEERAGFVQRERQRLAKAIEDQAYDNMRGALGS